MLNFTYNGRSYCRLPAYMIPNKIWQGRYISQVSGADFTEPHCPYYIHDREYERIAEKITEFISETEELQ